MKDVQFDYEIVSVDFLFTLCTFLPLYTSRGMWKCVSVHSTTDDRLGRIKKRKLR